ncbi:hypothetical protein HKX48_005409 [Thoreauomyces humboldtii]|nr:hypothetical protein HKX48_005409 [Thoreauomyces humboldtii]
MDIGTDVATGPQQVIAEEQPASPVRLPQPHYSKGRKDLPIYIYREELLNAIIQFQCLVVVGDTGSGKTTQLPQYILESLPGVRNMCVTQPRRIAAVSAAQRVAEEHGDLVMSDGGGSGATNRSDHRVGGTIGYSIRFERVCSPDTRLLYLTDGTLLRAVATDPEIRAYDLVILDEAHERSLETDVLFGLLRRACRLRPELKIVVMSATLDIDKFSDFFGDAPVFSIPGRMYAVDIFWQKKLKLETAKSTFIRRSVETVMHIHKNEEPGDILVFLTGQQEIETAIRMFQEAHDELDYADVRHSAHVRTVFWYPIFSSLDTLNQRAIFKPAPEGSRKIIFATNIAQTSVTIPGIRYVVDSGFVKQKMYDPATAVDALIVVPISQAAATQRAGRAGRTAVGKVYRLYSREAFDGMEAATVPEIQRSSLLGTVLALKTMGIEDVLNFEFIDPPDPELVVAATKQLFWLGALDEHNALTPLGEQMAEFPVSPYLSRAIISASLDFHCAHELLIIAAMLSVEEVFSIPRNKKHQPAAKIARDRFNDPTGDHLTLLRVFQAWEDTGCDHSWASDNFLHVRALKAAKQIRSQLHDVMDKLLLPVQRARMLETERDRKRKRRDANEDRFSSSHREGRRRESRREENYHSLDTTSILRSFCTAFFTNTAKRHSALHVFYPYPSLGGPAGTSMSSGQANNSKGGSSNQMMALCLQPGSALYEDDRCDYVMYNGIQYTNRASMRVVSKVQLEWVKVLMGRLSVVDETLHGDGAVGQSATSTTAARRMSIVDAVGAASGSGVATPPAVEGGPQPEFELVHELLDPSHEKEFVVGGGGDSEVGGRPASSDRPAGLDVSHASPASPTGNMPQHQHPGGETKNGLVDEETQHRAEIADAARQRYLKRKGRK